MDCRLSAACGLADVTSVVITCNRFIEVSSGANTHGFRDLLRYPHFCYFLYIFFPTINSSDNRLMVNFERPKAFI